MTSVKQIWNRISEFGVNSSNSFQLNKSIGTLNQSTFILCLVHLAGAVSYFTTEVYFLTYQCLILAFLITFIPLLNKYGFHKIALNSMLILVCAGIFVSDAYMGKDAITYIYFFPAIITTAFLTDIENRKQFYFHILIPVGFLILAIATDHRLFLNTEITQGQLQTIQWNNTLICSLVTIAFVFVIRKINHKAELNLLFEKNFLAQMFRDSADALLLIDSKTGNIEGSNEMATNYFETSKSQLEQSSFKQLFSSYDAQKFPLEEALHSKTNAEKNLEVEFKSFKGLTFWGNLALTYFVSKGKLFYVARIVNIDKQKKQEEIVKRATQEKEIFLSLIGHEIRTPLNAVIGMSYLLLEDNPSESQIDKLNVLKFSSEHLLGLINNVLDFNKIESNKLELELEQVDIQNLILNIKNLNSQAANKQQTIVVVEIDDHLPKFVIADAIRLGQIFNNLLSNAIKFTHKGEVVVRLVNVNSTSEKVMINCSVSDTGIGIAKDKQDKIFELFKQADAHTTRKYGGTGLGLSITKKLVELMGGKINLESELDKGSKFSFTLEFKIAPFKNESAKLENFDILKGKKALVVDDSVFNLMVARRFLEKSEVEVDIAESGTEAIDKAKKNSYDFVLMDLQMPEKDGYETALEIKMYLTNAPIIALSAMTMSELSQNLSDYGMDDYILKPFDPATFRSKIANALQHILLNEV